jgi:hypothetical protein
VCGPSGSHHWRRLGPLLPSVAHSSRPRADVLTPSAALPSSLSARLQVKFIDNQDVLDLVELRPNGLLPKLDDEIKVRTGADGRSR